MVRTTQIPFRMKTEYIIMEDFIIKVLELNEAELNFEADHPNDHPTFASKDTENQVYQISV